MIKQENLTVSAFYERYSGFTDDRIMEILHNQKDYQEAARNAAVQLAIERGLIHSENDLLAPEFQTSRNAKPTLFPSGSNTFYKNRLTGSIFRFLFIFSLLPVVYGVLSYARENLNSAIPGIASGAVWFILVFLMKKTKKPVFVFPLLALVIGCGAFVGFKLVTANSLRFLDFLVFAVGVLLPVYFLLYVRKLLKHQE